MRVIFDFIVTLLFLILQVISFVMSLLILYSSTCLVIGVPAIDLADVAPLVIIAAIVDIFNAVVTLIHFARKKGEE